MDEVIIDPTPDGAGSPGGAEWAVHAAGPADASSLCALAAADPASLPGPVLLDAIVASEKALSLLTGMQMRLLTAFAEPFKAGDPTRLAARLARKNCLTGDDDPDQVAVYVPEAAQSLAAAEVAAALRIAPVTAGHRVRDAAAMTGVLAPTLHAMEHGVLDRGKARVIAEHCVPLTPEHTSAVQHLVLPAAAALTTSELREITGHAVITVDPDGARDRHHAAAARRELALHALPDAMASLKAYLPADGAVKIFQVSDLLATGTAGTPDDTRGIGARRIDALVDIADQLLTHGHLNLAGYLGRPLPDHGTPPTRTRNMDPETTATHNTNDAHDTDPDPDPEIEIEIEVEVAQIADPGIAVHEIAVSEIAVSEIAVSEVAAAEMSVAQVIDARVTDAQMTDVESADAQVSDAESAGAQMTDAESAAAQVTDAESAAARVTDAESADARVTDAESAGARVTDAESAAARVTDVESVTAGVDQETDPDATPGADTTRNPRGPGNSGAVFTRQGRRPHLSVTLGLGTLAGLDDLPGTLAGFGAIPADLARSIAASAGTITALLTNPDTGIVTAAGALTYRPRQDLRDQIAATLNTCRFPSCRQPAWRCDIDHREPFDHHHPDRGGATTMANTDPYCRRHHLFKHHSEWQVRPDPDRTVLHFTSPTGHHYNKTGRQAAPPAIWVSTAGTATAEHLDTITNPANPTPTPTNPVEELLTAILIRNAINTAPLEYQPDHNTWDTTQADQHDHDHDQDTDQDQDQDQDYDISNPDTDTDDKPPPPF